MFLLFVFFFLPPRLPLKHLCRFAPLVSYLLGINFSFPIKQRQCISLPTACQLSGCKQVLWLEHVGKWGWSFSLRGKGSAWYCHGTFPLCCFCPLSSSMYDSLSCSLWAAALMWSTVHGPALRLASPSLEAVWRMHWAPEQKTLRRSLSLLSSPPKLLRFDWNSNLMLCSSCILV